MGWKAKSKDNRAPKGWNSMKLNGNGGSAQDRESEMNKRKATSLSKESGIKAGRVKSRLRKCSAEGKGKQMNEGKSEVTVA